MPVAVTLALVLGGCTAPGPSSPTTTGADATGATTGAAAYPPAVSDEDVLELVAALDAALGDGDEAAFLERVHPDLREEQRSWFAAVRSVPMEVRQLRADRVTSRQSPEGTMLHVGLRHQLTGADPVPVLQQYRWVVAPGEDGRPLLVSSRPRTGTFMGQPRLWDLGPVSVLEGGSALLLAPEDAREDAEALLPTIDEGAAAVLEDFPALAVDRLVVELVPEEVLVEEMGEDSTGDSSGVLWLRHSPTEPDPGRASLGTPAETLGVRVALEEEWTVQDHEDWGEPPGGHASVRYLGAGAAVTGPGADQVGVVWAALGYPGWYASTGSPGAVDDLRRWLAETLAGDPVPEEIPAPWSRDPADPELLGARSTAFVLHLADVYGQDAALAVAERVAGLDGWLDRREVDAAVADVLGVSADALLTGWVAWSEELAAGAEGEDFESGR